MNVTENGAAVRVERAFQRWVDQFRASGADEAAAASALEGEPDDVRAEVERRIADFRALRASLGGAAPRFEPGRVIGDFRLVRELGRGGMGAVFEAEQLSVGRHVALKLLFPHLGLSQSRLERFRREAVAGGRLAHPNVVTVHGVGEDDGVHWIALELVPGGTTLADEIARLRGARELPAGWYRRVAELFAAVADALAVAHEHGVVHRDVKPSNVLIDPQGRPRVADFGLARLEGEASLSRTGEMLGTPFYASPEQIGARRGGVDARTDVFSLGATLYEALTLTRPFDGDTSHQVWAKIRELDPPDPRALRSRVPRDLAVIAQKALEKDPERRYPTLRAMADDLRRFVASEPIHARPPGKVSRAMKLVRRHPVWSSVGAITFLALAIIFTLLVALERQNRVAHAERLLAQEQAELARQERERADAFASFLTEVIGSADPRTSEGPVTLDEVLDTARARLDDEAPDDPLLRAGLMERVGELYGSFGRDEEAQALLEHARQLRGGERERDSSERVLESLRERLGRLHPAHPRYRELREQIEQLETASDVNRSLRTARALVELGRIDEARAAYEEHIALLERALPPDHPDLDAAREELRALDDR